MAFLMKMGIGKHKLRTRIAIWFSFTFIILGILLFLFRNNVFKDLINPLVPFQVTITPPSIDYKSPKSWYYLENNNSKTAIFFIHPTTYYNGKKGWNANVEYIKSRKILDEIVIPNHLMPFSKAGSIYMPYYRQATLFATLAFNDDTKDALNLAYMDIDSAFTAFINHIGKDTNFMIVGINQGGLHASRLIQTKIANSSLEKRMLAAYLINQAISEESFTTQNFGNIKICSAPKQINCIMTYRIVDKENQRYQYLFKKRAPIWNAAFGYHPLLKKPSFCVNPLKGGAQAGASSKENYGSVAANGLEDAANPPFLPFETGANCDDGMLKVSASRSQNLKPNMFELGTFYKVEKYNLFYDALQKDAQNRNLKSN